MKILLLLICGILIFISAEAQHASCTSGTSTYTTWRKVGCVPCDDSWPDCDNLCGDNGVKISKVTKCCNGYERGSENEPCKPKCNPGCVKGMCVQPNECECLSGYERNRTAPNICDPDCYPQCINGICTAPGVCECTPGYKNISSHECVPKCEPGCINAICSAPNICTCREGYVDNQIGSTRNICVPKCSKGCENGDCIAPEVCKCHKGYEKVHSVCKPTCQFECMNGQCVRPNECECDAGYERNRTAPNICDPDCYPQCSNGICTAPGVCECTPGYKNISSHECVPNCEPGCINATCSASNVCTCKEGYVNYQTGSTHNICVPECTKGCQNGDCIAPEVCKCHKGYEKVHSVCKPTCQFGCFNGHCIRPNECECQRGYVLSNTTDGSGCLPSCKSDCIRGLCEAPNVCRCDKGTLKSGPFHCTPTCMEFPGDKECYFSSSLSISSLDYSLNNKGSSLVLPSNDSIVHYLPCVHRSNISRSAVVNYTCFTDPRVGEASAEIVCSITTNTTHHSIYETDWSARLKSSEIKTVNMVLLHHNSSSLCTARICSHSNREFHISRLSNLRMCIDGKIAESQVLPGLSIGLYSYSVVAIVVTSAVVAVAAKCIARNNKFYNRSDRNRISQAGLTEAEPEGGELGPQAFEFTDISDRLEDLK